jgi:signal peptidase I
MKKFLKIVGSLFVFFFFVYGAASFLNDYIIRYEKIEGSSMKPALVDGQHVLISPIPFWIKEPSRFEIIAFSSGGTFYVKRIIGLPKERVAIRDGKIYINGEVLLENYGKEEIEAAMEEITLEEDEYFVLGDNRNFSIDSRSAEIGAVHREQIIGKVLFD